MNNQTPISKPADSEQRSGKGLSVQRLVMAIFVMAALYFSAAWVVFQWRNPLSNEMSFYRDFSDVATWKKLPEYQP